jgi:hypothetical protein
MSGTHPWQARSPRALNLEERGFSTSARATRTRFVRGPHAVSLVIRRTGETPWTVTASTSARVGRQGRRQRRSDPALVTWSRGHVVATGDGNPDVRNHRALRAPAFSRYGA